MALCEGYLVSKRVFVARCEYQGDETLGRPGVTGLSFGYVCVFRRAPENGRTYGADGTSGSSPARSAKYVAVQYNTLSTGNPVFSYAVFNYAVFKSSGGEVSGLQLRLVIGAVQR